MVFCFHAVDVTSIHIVHATMLPMLGQSNTSTTIHLLCPFMCLQFSESKKPPPWQTDPPDRFSTSGKAPTEANTCFPDTRQQQPERTSPDVHVLLDPSLPSGKTDSMVFGVHAVKIQQSCLPCFRWFDIPTPLQPSIYPSFHMSSFLKCQETAKMGPKILLTVFPPPGKAPKGGNTNFPYTATTTTGGHFRSLTSTKWCCC